MDPVRNATPKPRRRWKRWLRGLLLFLLFVAGWYAVDRGLATGRMVRIIEDRSIAPAGTSADVSQQADGRTLRIGTWNIAHGRGPHESGATGEHADRTGRRIDAIAELLAAEDLDLIMLNEVDFDSSRSGRVNQAEVIARAAGYPWRAEQRNVDVSIPLFALRFGNVILSRHPIVAAEAVDFPWPNRWQPLLAGKKRGCIVTIELPDGSRLQVAPIHLDHRWGGTEIRTQSLGLVLETSDPALPLVAAGDFNTSLPGFPGVRASRQQQTALSTFLDEGALQTSPTDAPQPGDYTFRSTNPDRVIDWIVVPRSWSIISRRVIQTDLSDHRPVIMEVEIDR